MIADLEQLLSYTERDENDCLIWQRCFSTDGYPRAVIGGNNNSKVHRVVYDLSNSQPLEERIVRHICDNPKCINPDHLLAGTMTDNMKDRRERARTYGHVPEKEIKIIKALKARGYTHVQIGYTLSIKTKRVDYILNKY